MILAAVTIKGLTVIFLALFAIVLLLIIMVLLYGIKNYNLLKNETEWRKLILEKIAIAILEDTERTKDDQELRRLLKNTDFSKMFLSILIESNKKFSGHAYTSLVKLFYSLDLDEVAWYKLRSKKPFKIVRGIEALTSMKERDALPEINSLINHPNPIVASEAQYAVVRFEDFRGLEFLTRLKAELSEWQQIQLLNAISEIPSTSYSFLSEQLTSTNPSIVRFILSLIRKFRIFDLHDEVAKLLTDSNTRTRALAIKTLQDIENDSTMVLLMNLYDTQEPVAKRAILQAIKKSKNKTSIEFLKNRLLEDTTPNQILAAEILVKLNETEYLKSILNDSTKSENIHSIVKHTLMVKL